VQQKMKTTEKEKKKKKKLTSFLFSRPYHWRLIEKIIQQLVVDKNLDDGTELVIISAR